MVSSARDSIIEDDDQFPGLAKDRRLFFHLVSLSAACAVPAVDQDSPADSIDLAKLADDYFLPLLANKGIRAAAVIVLDNQKLVLAKRYGPVDLEHTPWRAASVSKALTAIGVMRLVEQGKVNLDADVNQYLKSFQLPSTYQRPITLRQLLEHRSGLDDRFIGDGFRNGEQPTLGELMAFEGAYSSTTRSFISPPTEEWKSTIIPGVKDL